MPINLPVQLCSHLDVCYLGFLTIKLNFFYIFVPKKLFHSPRSIIDQEFMIQALLVMIQIYN